MTLIDLKAPGNGLMTTDGPLTSDGLLGERLLVFGGPYSNLRALKALRHEAERLRIAPQHVVCTGDVIAYCAEPGETVEAIRDWGCHVVAGNCEEQVAAGADDCGCGFEPGTTCDLLAKDWFSYTKPRISADDRQWMAALPRQLRFQISDLRVLVVHGSVTQSNRFLFASQATAIDEELANADADLVIAGHAGLPFISARPAGTWFNAGAIGMPANDGTPDGWYGLIEPNVFSPLGAVSLSAHRLVYDWQGAADAMHAAGLAEPYASALRTGLWPSLDILPEIERSATGRPLDRLSVRVALPALPSASKTQFSRSIASAMP